MRLAVVGLTRGWQSLVAALGFVTMAGAQPALDPAIVVQPTNRAAAQGAGTTFVVGATGTPPLAYCWRKEGAALLGATTSSLALSGLQSTNSGRYDVVVTNGLGSVTSAVAVLTVNTADSLNISADDVVYAFAPLPDGGTIIGGAFKRFGGIPHPGLARFHADCTPDLGFNTGASNTVYCLLVQPDGKILVGGAFTNLAGQACKYLGRIYADGRLDTTFNPGVSNTVYALALQPDGLILVGGAFTAVAGQPRQRLARISPDGSLDPGFAPVANGEVDCLAVQPDGAILVGGAFTTLDGAAHAYLGRLDSSGTVDPSFTANAGAAVYSLALQADGRILVAGHFTSLRSLSRPYIGRLESDGSLDSSFTPAANGDVYTLALQADGRILLGGAFSTMTGQPRSYLARLKPDGSVDDTFNPGANGQVRSLGIQQDGKVLAGGAFTTLAGSTRTRLGRLGCTAPATGILTNDGMTITWLRGGSSPEVSQATFETSTNGADWVSLGTPQRVEGGWQLAGVVCEPSVTLRARGTVAGGGYCGSGWFVETGLGPPVISRQPVDQLTFMSGRVTFSAVATGSSEMGYQWYRDGVAIPGATNAWLTLNVIASNAGSRCEVVATNALGGARSSVAQVWVLSADSFAPSPSDSVYALAVQADGKILVGGSFATIGSGSSGNLARLNPSGTLLDATFHPAANGTVRCLAVQDGGRILVGGYFTSLGGAACSYLGRLNLDGTRDTTFSPPSITPLYSHAVECLALQPDGKVLFGGGFLGLAGGGAGTIARLNADGTLDTTFTPPTYSGLSISSLATYAITLLPDGQILTCGYYPDATGNRAHYVERLDSNGNLVSKYGFISPPSPVYAILSSALQPDGKILMGGYFVSFDGYPRQNLQRLNNDGSIDPAFTNTWANNTVYALAIQTDGRILVGGSFSTLNGRTRNGLGRLNSDGTIDSSFDSATNNAGGTVCSLAMQTDGKVLVGGTFTNLAGYSRKRLGRLNNTGPATESLSCDGGTVNWMRSGVGPEFWRTTFDSSTDGTTWSYLGEGMRTADGWQLSASLPVGTLVRARGAVVGHGSSTWLAEVVSGAPVITNHPAHCTNNPGAAAVFNVGAAGTPSLNYQWLKDGIALTDGGWITGTRTPTLVLSSVRAGDAGGYSVIVTNSFGQATSQVALLSVSSPLPPRPTIPQGGDTGFHSNRFGFHFQAQAGQAIVIEASTNLIHWAPVHTNLSADSNPVLFCDSRSRLFPRRFYRAGLYQGPIPAPTLRSDGVSSFESGQFQFEVEAVGGQTVVVEVSTNLTSWSCLATNLVGFDPLCLVDPTSPGFSRRFYRVRLQ